MATQTRRPAKRKASPEKVAAAKARDAALDAKADAALADPAAFAARLMGAIGGNAPSLSRFSIRNQALLLEQAEEAQAPVSQVATFRQWAAMGRMVRKGERSYLRVVQPVGRVGRQVDENGKPADDDTRAEADAEGPTVFKFLPMFDISQTDPLEEGEITQEGEELAARDAAAATDPLGTLADKLTEQAERLGYTVNHGGEPQFDADARTLTIGDVTPENLQALTAVVADLVQTRRVEAQAARDARKVEQEARGRADVPAPRSGRVSAAQEGDVETFTVL